MALVPKHEMIIDIAIRILSPILQHFNLDILPMMHIKPIWDAWIRPPHI